MAWNTNRVVLSGRLSDNAEVTQTNNGKTVAKFSIGNSRGEETSWFKCVAFGKTAEICGTITKGTLVMVDGHIVIQQWTDKNGNKNSSPQVIVENVEIMYSKKKNDNADGGFYLSEVESNGEPCPF